MSYKYPKLKPCSDVEKKTQSKFIGCVHKNTSVSVGKRRTDHDATVTQCNPTTVEMIPEKGADVKHMSNEDASAKRCTNKSTQEHGINEDDEQGTWIQVVDRRRKRKEQTK